MKQELRTPLFVFAFGCLAIVALRWLDTGIIEDRFLLSLLTWVSLVACWIFRPSKWPWERIRMRTFAALKWCSVLAAVVAGVALGTHFLQQRIQMGKLKAMQKSDWRPDVYLLVNHYDAWIETLDSEKRRQFQHTYYYDEQWKHSFIRSTVLESIFGRATDGPNFSEEMERRQQAIETTFKLPASVDAEDFNRTLGNFLRDSITAALAQSKKSLEPPKQKP